MKATQSRSVSAAVVVLSALLLAATLVLPNVRVPQTVQQSVPPWSTSQQDYQIYGYGIPSVTSGTYISVTLTGFKPYSLQYVLAPTIGNRILQPLAFGEVGSGPNFTFSGTAEGTYSLELTINAYSGSGFGIRYSGVWSPFDFLRVYFAPAVFLLAASLVATYYFGTRIPMQLAEEKVERELAGEARKSRT